MAGAAYVNTVNEERVAWAASREAWGRKVPEERAAWAASREAWDNKVIEERLVWAAASRGQYDLGGDGGAAELPDKARAQHRLGGLGRLRFGSFRGL